MNYQSSCNQLKNTLVNLEKLVNHFPESTQKKYLQELNHDIKSDFYTVIVLGEFKRGKSTLLNSLIGQALLPVDVTPTTATINVLRYSDNLFLQIHRPGGIVEDKSLDKDLLKEFVAGDNFDPHTVEYLEIGLPSPILRNNMIYIDTPGVDDLNQQRVDITYRFVPRADAVIFLLDATAPVRKSEQEFLEDSVLKNGIEKIIFVANFSDLVDEEEKEELSEIIKRRLAKALGCYDFPVYLVSAYQGLEGILNNDKEMIVKSGIPDLIGLLQHIQKTGPGSEAKFERFFQRTEKIISDMEREIELIKETIKSSDEDLKKQLIEIDNAFKSNERRHNAVDEWFKDRENEIIAITRKSLQHFSNNLKEDIKDYIDDYKGTNFKEFVETKIPQVVKKRCKQWIETHSIAIAGLIKQLEKKIATVFAKEFNTIMKTGHNISSISEEKSVSFFTFNAEDVSGSTIIAGLITGGVAVLLSIMGGPIFMPLISMAGFPFLRQTLLDHSLAKAKAHLHPELRKILDEVIGNFSSNITDAVRKELQSVKKITEENYNNLLNSIHSKLKEEVNNRETKRVELTSRENELKSFEELLMEIKNELKSMNKI